MGTEVLSRVLAAIPGLAGADMLAVVLAAACLVVLALSGAGLRIIEWIAAVRDRRAI
jgi:hypothetical protein